MLESTIKIVPTEEWSILMKYLSNTNHVTLVSEEASAEHKFEHLDGITFLDDSGEPPHIHVNLVEINQTAEDNHVIQKIYNDTDC